MRSSKKNRIIKFILFFALLIVINEFLKFALIDDISMRNNIARCTDNAYDIVFIGTSQLRSGLDPDIVSKTLGKSVTNASIPLSTPLDQYFFIKEICLSGNKPQCIVYECDPYYFTDGKAGGHSYAYPFGKNKIEYFLSGLQQDWRTVLTPWSFQWMNYNNMPSIISRKLSFMKDGYDEIYKGYSPTDATFKSKDIIDRDFEISDIADEYLKKMCDYCKKNDIKLIITQFPVAKQVYDDMEPTYRNGADEYFESIALAYGIEYINCNDWSDDIFKRSFDSFVDMEGHIRISSVGDFSVGMSEAICKKSEY